MRLIYLCANAIFGHMMGKVDRDFVKWISMLYIVYSCQSRIGLTLSDLRTNRTYEHAPEMELYSDVWDFNQKKQYNEKKFKSPLCTCQML